jgi:biopolymer transport protein ExbB
MLPNWFSLLGPTGWPLAFCAVLALAICFERIVFIVTSRVEFKKQYENLSQYLVAHQSLPKAIRDEMVGVLINELQPAYYRGLKLLRLISTVSPLLGLLGTILGIIVAFKTIALQTGPVSPSLIADGLWEAMLTTAVGLMIALPCLLFAHVFSASSEKKLSLLCLLLNKLSIRLEIEKTTEEPEMIKTNVKRIFA